MTPDGAGRPRPNLAAAFGRPPGPPPAARTEAAPSPVTLVPDVTDTIPAPAPASPATAPASTAEPASESATMSEVDLTRQSPSTTRATRGRSIRPGPPAEPEDEAEQRQLKKGAWIPSALLAKIHDCIKAERGGETITDVVLSAVAAHHENIAKDRKDRAERSPERDSPFEHHRRTRRRRPNTSEPSTQISLQLTDRDRATLDQMAAAVGMTRSAYITEALRRAL